MAPRKVIGTVDTSEFLVALCASIGFLVALSHVGFALPIVGALLLGGVVAAPVAAWLGRLMHPRVLGAAVGGLIVLTNGRTLLRAAGIEADLGLAVYGVIAMVWAVALTVAVRAVRT